MSTNLWEPDFAFPLFSRIPIPLYPPSCAFQTIFLVSVKSDINTLYCCSSFTTFGKKTALPYSVNVIFLAGFRRLTSTESSKTFPSTFSGIVILTCVPARFYGCSVMAIVRHGVVLIF